MAEITVFAVFKSKPGSGEMLYELLRAMADEARNDPAVSSSSASAALTMTAPFCFTKNGIAGPPWIIIRRCRICPNTAKPGSPIWMESPQSAGGWADRRLSANRPVLRPRPLRPGPGHAYKEGAASERPSGIFAARLASRAEKPAQALAPGGGRKALIRQVRIRRGTA